MNERQMLRHNNNNNLSAYNVCKAYNSYNEDEVFVLSASVCVHLSYNCLSTYRWIYCGEDITRIESYSG